MADVDDVERRILERAMRCADAVPLVLASALAERAGAVDFLSDDPRDVPAALAAYRSELHHQVDEAADTAVSDWCRWRGFFTGRSW